MNSNNTRMSPPGNVVNGLQVGPWETKIDTDYFFKTTHALEKAMKKKDLVASQILEYFVSGRPKKEAA